MRSIFTSFLLVISLLTSTVGLAQEQRTKQPVMTEKEVSSQREEIIEANRFGFSDKLLGCIFGAGIGAVGAAVGAGLSDLSDASQAVAISSVLSCGLGYIFTLNVYRTAQNQEEVANKKRLRDNEIIKAASKDLSICVAEGRCDAHGNLIEENETSEDYIQMRSGN